MRVPLRPAGEKWRQFIDDQQASGRTVAAYCREHGISQPSFFAWKRRLRDSAATPPFVEVKVGSGERAVGSAMEVCLAGRHILVRRGFDHDLLVELVQTLERLPAPSLPAVSLSNLSRLS